jgi:hypothetical protein
LQLDKSVFVSLVMRSVLMKVVDNFIAFHDVDVVDGLILLFNTLFIIS